MSVDPTSRGSVIVALLLLMVGYGLTKHNQQIIEANTQEQSKRKPLATMTVEEKMAAQADEQIKRLRLDLLNAESVALNRDETLKAIKMAEKIIAVARDKKELKQLKQLEKLKHLEAMEWTSEQEDSISEALESIFSFSTMLEIDSLECASNGCEIVVTLEQPATPEQEDKILSELKKSLFNDSEQNYELVLDKKLSDPTTKIFHLRPLRKQTVAPVDQ